MRSNSRPRSDRRFTALLARVERALARAPRGALVTATVRLSKMPDPLAWLAESSNANRVYWSASGRTLAGLGAAAFVRATGSSRFDDAARRWAALVEGALRAGPVAAGPIALGGFAFDAESGWRGFPSLRFIVPRVLLDSSAKRTLVTICVTRNANAEAELRAARRDLDQLGRRSAPSSAPSARIAGSVPDDAQWRRAVARAARDVREGAVGKVVLARAWRVSGDAPFAAGAVLSRLQWRRHAVCVFWVGSAAGSFIGATPEWIARVRGSRVQTVALAGSAPIRCPAATLLASSKDRSEHALVDEAMVAALQPVSRRIRRSTLEVATFGYIRHLRTRMTAWLHEPLGPLRIAARLHPTPAIGGSPRDVALGMIRRREVFARGWYGGGVGWIDGDGNGDIALAIRSALLKGKSAWVYAGAGIVGASRPAAELAEIETKAAPMMRALGVAR